VTMIGVPSAAWKGKSLTTRVPFGRRGNIAGKVLGKGWLDVANLSRFAQRRQRFRDMAWGQGFLS